MKDSLTDMPPVDMLPKFTKDAPWYKRLKAWFSRRRWMFREDYLIYLPDGTCCLIPTGFVLDFASVPRLAWPILHPLGLLMLASIVHDFVYKRGYLLFRGGIKEKLSRRQADKLLRDVAIGQTGIRTGSWLAWGAVRVGGWWAWGKNRKEKT